MSNDVMFPVYKIKLKPVEKQQMNIHFKIFYYNQF